MPSGSSTIDMARSAGRGLGAFTETFGGRGTNRYGGGGALAGATYGAFSDDTSMLGGAAMGGGVGFAGIKAFGRFAGVNALKNIT